jgi:ribonuclease T1
VAFGLLAGSVAGGSVWARAADAPAADVSLGSLPEQAQKTYRLVRSGGPFPYHQDGVVFGNREHRLPSKDRGYYREYTVKTPGAANRGARRIICGGPRPTEPDTCFYTADHYTSFSRIAP